MRCTSRAISLVGAVVAHPRGSVGRVSGGRRGANARPTLNLLHDVDPVRCEQSASSLMPRLTPIDATTNSTIFETRAAVRRDRDCLGTRSETYRKSSTRLRFLFLGSCLSPSIRRRGGFHETNLQGIANSRPGIRAASQDPTNFKQLLEVMLPGDTAPKWEQRMPRACRAAFERRKELDGRPDDRGKLQPAVQDRSADRSERQLCDIRHPDKRGDV